MGRQFLLPTWLMPGKFFTISRHSSDNFFENFPDIRRINLLFHSFRTPLKRSTPATHPIPLKGRLHVQLVGRAL